MKKIKWLLFHEPAELFIRTAEHFSEEINKLSSTGFEIEILKLEDYNEKYNNGEACDPIAEMRAGKVQMSQLYANSLAGSGAGDFTALSLPFLFRSHDHATKVFESEVGSQLLQHLQDKVGVKGLCFTYSGGYRMLASDTPVKCIEELKGLSYRENDTALWSDLFNTLGMTPTIGEPNITQTTYPRYEAEARAHQKYIADTGHSMYLTTIMANEEFWNDLSVEDQLHFKTAAQICARAERTKSVDDAETIKTDTGVQSELGISQIFDFDDAERNKLEQALESVSKKWEKYFTTGLVDKIRKI